MAKVEPMILGNYNNKQKGGYGMSIKLRDLPVEMLISILRFSAIKDISNFRVTYSASREITDSLDFTTNAPTKDDQRSFKATKVSIHSFVCLIHLFVLFCLLFIFCPD